MMSHKKKIQKKKKIQDENKVYKFLRNYVDWSLLHAYRDIEYNGLEKIPQDAAVIYAPNHSNALMDALVVLAIDKSRKVFVARADIFKNPFLAKILTFLKIMPIMRIRDGVDEVKKNQEIIDKSVDVLRDGIPFCILPEGTHRAQHSLLPISKGIFRIALQAQELITDNRDVCIVPVGIEYGNYFRYRSTVRVQIGDPINIRQYCNEHADLQTPEIINGLRTRLTRAMQELILYLPADEHYAASYELIAMAAERTSRALHQQDKSLSTLELRFRANRQTAAAIARLRETQAAEELLQQCDQIHQMRVSEGISLASTVPAHPWRKRGWNYLACLLTAPYLCACLLAIAPIAGIGKMLFRIMKDEAFRNSVRFVLQLVLWPILMLIYGIVLYCALPWAWASLIFVALTPAPIFAQDFFRNLRLFWSDLKLTGNRPLRERIKQAKARYFELIQP